MGCGFGFGFVPVHADAVEELRRLLVGVEHLGPRENVVLVVVEGLGLGLGLG